MRILTYACGEKYYDIAIKIAGRLAQASKAELTFLYVRPKIPTTYKKVYEGWLDKHGKSVGEQVEFKRVEDMLFKHTDELLKEFKIKPKKIMREGKVAEEILKESDRGYHLLIAGSTGLKGMLRTLFGSISYEVAEYAKIPVLVVKKDVEIKNILVATDGSESALEAEYCAGGLAKGLSANVTILSVAPEEVLKSEAEKAVEKGRETLKKEFGIDAAAKVRVGGVRSEILAESKDYDLVVVGSRGLSKVKRILMGHVSLKVKEDADTNVLVVRHCIFYKKKR